MLFLHNFHISRDFPSWGDESPVVSYSFLFSGSSSTSWHNTATVVSRSFFISSVATPSTPPAFPFFFFCCIDVLISACVTRPVSISSASQASLSASDRVRGGLTPAKCFFHLFFTSSSFVVGCLLYSLLSLFFYLVCC